MNVLIEKYNNCCKFCLEINQDPSANLHVLGADELEDVATIKELMGCEIIDDNADYAKVLKNAVCYKCASQIISFQNFRTACNEKFKTFKNEFDQVRRGKQVQPQIFVCDACFTKHGSEDLLRLHKKHVHKNNLPEVSDDNMEIDESCGQPSLIVSEDEDDGDQNDNRITEYYECKDCHRKFLPEDKSIYRAHCRTCHPKKVPCPFGCLVTPLDKDNPVRAKKKLFKNFYYLANHLQNQHLNVVKTEVA